jgi:hypothetical protein
MEGAWDMHALLGSVGGGPRRAAAWLAAGALLIGLIGGGVPASAAAGSQAPGAPGTGVDLVTW